MVEISLENSGLMITNRSLFIMLSEPVILLLWRGDQTAFPTVLPSKDIQTGPTIWLAQDLK